MELVAIVVILALLEYFFFTAAAGKARGESGIEAPAMTGDETFERHVRVQGNTLEALIIFIPAIYLFATYVHVLSAVIIGLFFIIGRAMYYKAYINAPEKRGPGAILSALSNIVLLLGGLVGIVSGMI